MNILYNKVWRQQQWLKVLVLLFILSLQSIASMRAQVGEHRSELALGVSGGYLMNSVGFVPKVPQTQHGGLTGGFAVRYTSEKYFSSICAIVAELNYAQIGWKEEILTIDDAPVINVATGLAEQYQRDMTYLQVPVLARLGWGRERKGLQAFFQIGPQVGFNIGESTKTNFELTQRNIQDRTSQIIAQDTMGIERKFDYGITGGLGLEYSHPRLGHFLLEGRYYYGLGDFYGNTKRDYFARSNHSTIVVKLTYLFDLLKTNNPKIK